MNYKELNKTIKNKEIFSVYLFTGPEYYIGNMMEKNLTKKIISKGLEPLNITIFNDKISDTSEILATCETLPLMSEKRLVIIKEDIQIGKISDKKTIDQWMNYLEKPSPTTVLVIYWKQPDKRKKIYKGLLKYGTIVNFEKLDRRDLEHWINRRLKIVQKIISKSIMDLFIQRTLYLSNENKTMENVDHDLNQLIDYVGDRQEILKDDIVLIMPQSIEEGVFKMIDYGMAGKKGEAMIMLNQFYLQGESPFGVFSLLVRQIRLLLMVKLYIQKGLTPKAIAGEMKLAPFIVNKILKNGRNYPIDNLWKLMEIAAEIDCQMKTGKINQNFGLELFLMKIA